MFERKFKFRTTENPFRDPPKVHFVVGRSSLGGGWRVLGLHGELGFGSKGGVRGLCYLGGLWGLRAGSLHRNDEPLSLFPPKPVSPQPTWIFSLSFALMPCFRLSSCWVPISFPTSTSSTTFLSFPEMLKHLFASLISLPSLSFLLTSPTFQTSVHSICGFLPYQD